MYRDDDAAHAQRASSLIDEIAELERQKLAQSQTAQRLDAAKRELAALQVSPGSAPPDKPPGVLVHLFVFSATATLAYLGYTLLA